MRANDIVYHSQFGIGRVVSIATRYVTVDFNGTRKRFVAEDSTKWLLPVIENQFVVINGQLLEYIGEESTVSIPKCVTKIGCQVFAKNESLISINFNGHIKEIGDSAFEGCTKLTHVTGINGLVSIGSRAFQDCKNLEVISLPNSLESIEGATFCRCKTLKQINIPPRIRKISYETFLECNSLTNVTGMNGVKFIEHNAFRGCSRLRIRLPEGLLKIERQAFASCDAMHVFEIPKSVTYIGAAAFTSSSSDPVISGEKGSVAEEYARKQGFTFNAADNTDIGDGQKILPKRENPQKQSQDKIPTTVLKPEPNVASHKATPQVSPAPSKKNKTSRVLIPLVAILAVFIGITQYFDISSQGFINRISNEVQMAKKGEIQDDNGIYTGDLNKGVFEGLGTMQFADGRVYSGDWENHLMHGEGNFQWTDGTAYAGQMSYGVIDGEGVVYYSNGSRYEGSFKNGLRFGTGTYYWVNGDTYIGEWKEDLPHGIGTWARGSTTTYIGTFDEGHFVDGEYTVDADNYVVTLSVVPNDEDCFDVTFLDGTVYSGTVEKTIVVNQIRYSSGDKYSGCVEKGLRNGQGTYTWATGESYQGNWENDVMSGKGKFTFANGDALISCVLSYYYIINCIQRQ